MHGVSRGRLVVGIAALIALGLMAVFLPRIGGLRQKAVVEAGRTFSFRDLESGRYTTNLRDGAPARGQGMVNQQILQFQRSELLDMELTPGLENGSQVTAGDVLATIRSPRMDRQLSELKANRLSLEATRDLLAAGGRPSEVREARRELELAQATRDGELPQLERLQALAAEDLVSAAELEAAELQDEIRRLEIELARASLAVVQSSARPEELAALDAEIDAVDSRLTEIELLVGEGSIKSPIDGILEVGGRTTLLRVYDIETVYLRIPIPEADRYRVEMGDKVEFVTPSISSETFVGEIIELGENATNLNGMQIFWASAQVPNETGILRSGMTGTVNVQLSGKGKRGLLSTLFHEAVGG